MGLESASGGGRGQAPPQFTEDQGLPVTSRFWAHRAVAPQGPWPGFAPQGACQAGHGGADLGIKDRGHLCPEADPGSARGGPPSSSHLMMSLWVTPALRFSPAPPPPRRRHCDVEWWLFQPSDSSHGSLAERSFPRRPSILATCDAFRSLPCSPPPGWSTPSPSSLPRPRSQMNWSKRAGLPRLAHPSGTFCRLTPHTRSTLPLPGLAPKTWTGPQAAVPAGSRGPLSGSSSERRLPKTGGGAPLGALQAGPRELGFVIWRRAGGGHSERERIMTDQGPDQSISSDARSLWWPHSWVDLRPPAQPQGAREGVCPCTLCRGPRVGWVRWLL